MPINKIRSKGLPNTFINALGSGAVGVSIVDVDNEPDSQGLGTFTGNVARLKAAIVDLVHARAQSGAFAARVCEYEWKLQSHGNAVGLVNLMASTAKAANASTRRSRFAPKAA